MDDSLLSWEVLEHEHHHTEPEWYWMVGIIAISVSVAAFLLSDPLFGVLVVIGAFTLSLYSAKGPFFTKVAIGASSITVNGKSHPYTTIDSFSLDGDKLILEKSAFFHPLIIIRIEEGVPIDDLRRALGLKLKEHTHTEPLSHKIMTALGF